MPIRGLLFDKDGTLLDYHRTWMDVNWALATHLAGENEAHKLRLMVRGGYDPASGLVRSGTPLAAGTAREIAECFAPDLDEDALCALAAAYEEIFIEGACRAAVPVDFLRDTLRGLRSSGYRLGIATTDSEKGIYSSLGRFEVLELFDFLAGHDSGHGVKPEPGMVSAFCVAVALPAAEVAVIGDNPHDLAMGRAAGAGLLVGVLTGTSKTPDLAPLADHVLESVADLPALLNRLPRAG